MFGQTNETTKTRIRTSPHAQSHMLLLLRTACQLVGDITKKINFELEFDNKQIIGLGTGKIPEVKMLFV